MNVSARVRNALAHLWCAGHHDVSIDQIADQVAVDGEPVSDDHLRVTVVVLVSDEVLTRRLTRDGALFRLRWSRLTPHPPEVKALAVSLFDDGLSADVVGRRLGLPTSTVASWCVGRRRPRLPSEA